MSKVLFEVANANQQGDFHGWTRDDGTMISFAQKLADVTGAYVIAAGDQVTPVSEIPGTEIFSCLSKY